MNTEQSTTTTKPVALYYRILDYCSDNLSLLDRLFELRELPDPGSDTPELLADVEVLFAPLGFAVDRQKLTQCAKLRVILSNTTGIPHIDQEAAASLGITICALHDEPDFLESITPTAEHTIGLLLAVWRRVPWAHAAVLRGEWRRSDWPAHRMLSRMRLGIVGFGRLGRKVARAADALGMDVNFFDPGVDGGAPSIIELAKKSDVLSLHAVANSETKGLVSRDVMDALPAGAVIINTARGELLDTDALVDLLEAKHIAAAGLDTIDGEYNLDFESTLPKSRLIEYAATHDNLILTPHIGGSTLDAWAETQRRVIHKGATALGLEAQL